MSAVVGPIGRSLLHAGSAVLLALAVLLAAGAPAHAAVRYEITAPTGTVTGPTTIQAEVEAERYERIDEVELRLLRGSVPYGPVRSLTHADGSREPGATSLWKTDLDPLKSWAAAGGAMHNGTYTFEIRVTSTTPLGPRQTAWAGRQVVLDVYPPATSVSVQVLDHGTRSVEVSWDPSTVPDFRRYVVQRARTDGWTDVTTLTTASTTRFVDVLPDWGTYRYRVMVVRDSGTGGDSPTTSGERSVTVRDPEAVPEDVDPTNGEPADPSQPGQPGSDPTPGPGGDGDDPGATEADPGAEAGDDEEPATSAGFGRRSGSGAPPASGDVTVPSIGSTRSSDPTPQPQTTSPGSDTFEELLPYETTEREVTERITEVRRGEAIEGGTLSVHNRELELEQVLPPLAGGLLLFVVGGHVLRLRRD